jgi:hypothetical protein
MGKDTSDRGLIASSLSPFMRQVGPRRAPWPGLGVHPAAERPCTGLTCPSAPDHSSCACAALAGHHGLVLGRVYMLKAAHS